MVAPEAVVWGRGREAHRISHPSRAENTVILLGNTRHE
jgi:hypothetical protein